MIRKAEYEDIENIIELGINIYEQQKCKELSCDYNKEIIREKLKIGIKHDFLYVYEENNKILGMLWAYIDEYFFDPNLKILKEKGIYTNVTGFDEEKRKLAHELGLHYITQIS